MSKISQKKRYRQSLIKYAIKYGVTKATARYATNRQYVYRWMKRYDGSLESFRDKSRRPRHHPNEHSPAELLLIRNMLRHNKNTRLVVLLVKLRKRGYSRSISALYRVMKRIGAVRITLPNPKCVSKPNERMQYPGQRVQVDVKFVPKSCLVGEAEGKQFYQYTAIDEYSRFRYVEAEEYSTYSSAAFLTHMLRFFKFRVKCVHSDNRTEFTNRFTSDKDKPTLFENHLEQCVIRHKLIKPYTPRHNGKAERSHRNDNEYFYASHKRISSIRRKILLSKLQICQSSVTAREPHHHSDASHKRPRGEGVVSAVTCRQLTGRRA
ncbi:DDE-type integrase/transposase/recombinase [Cloacibacillus sp. An23]|uniref:DDE-type integrase/transposase/recombinase n=1 Tax=Cloacibacillus sp. An23 TaxID=1965591 RepID=UPI000B39BD04|nr:IS481 family transposase [Cloacibacillus sp. An23]